MGHSPRGKRPLLHRINTRPGESEHTPVHFPSGPSSAVLLLWASGLGRAQSALTGIPKPGTATFPIGRVRREHGEEAERSSVLTEARHDLRMANQLSAIQRLESFPGKGFG